MTARQTEPPTTTRTLLALGAAAGPVFGFLGLIAACFVLAARFRGEGRSSWMMFSLATGVLFFAGFAGIASGAQSRTLVVAFYLAVLLAWTWLSALFRSAPVRAEG
jgi:hypothetical protein